MKYFYAKLTDCIVISLSLTSRWFLCFEMIAGVETREYLKFSCIFDILVQVCFTPRDRIFLGNIFIGSFRRSPNLLYLEVPDRTETFILVI